MKEHPDAITVLQCLNSVCGRHYRETEANLSIISARLQEPGVDLDGVVTMILRQAAKWRCTEYAEYLRPETLFRRSKFDSYYAARCEPVPQRRGDNSRNAGLAGGEDVGRADRILASRAARAQGTPACSPVANQVDRHGENL